jgi:extracellular elastinolytic metalloproteinase
MVAFNKFFASVFLAIVYASSGLAVPWPASSKHATHRVRTVARGLKLNTFHPASTFEVSSFVQCP